MKRIWTIARIELTRLLRDRSNLFFVFVFPLLLVLLIGAQFGGGGGVEVGAVAPDDEPAERLLETIEDAGGFRIVEVEDADRLRDEVSRGVLSAGVVLPDDYGARVVEVAPTEVAFIGRPDSTAASVRAVVSAAVAQQRQAGQAAALVDDQLEGGDRAALRTLALDLQEELDGVSVRAETVGTDEIGEQFAGLGPFDLGASSQLFLFTFLTSLASSAALIQLRQYGVAHRMLASPTPMRQIVGGLTAGRLLIALVQALYIVVATVVLFQVDWGDPLATGVVILLFSLVSAAAGMLIGAAMRNDNQASGVGVGLGIGFAALGGSMVPLELLPDGIRLVARITPHAWANEAMAEIVRRDAGLGDVLPQVLALGGFAAVLLVLGTLTLQRTLTR